MYESLRNSLCELAGFSRVVVGVDLVLFLLLAMSSPSVFAGDGPLVIWAASLIVVLASFTLALASLRLC